MPEDNELFAKYRDAYLKGRLKDEGYTDDAEVETGLEYVKDRLDEDDRNIDDVIKDYKIATRVEERKKSVDPSPMNGHRTKFNHGNAPRDLARHLYDRAKGGGK